MKTELTLEQYRRYQKQAEDSQRAVDRAQGAYDQALSHLKQKFKVGSLEEAEALLSKLQRREEKAHRKFIVQLEKFVQQHPEVAREAGVD